MKHYLKELTNDEIKELILYPSELWNTLYICVSDSNDYYVSEILEGTLGKDYDKWTKFDSTSYGWYLNIKSGYYRHMLETGELDWLTDDYIKDLRNKQAELKEIVNKIDELDDTLDGRLDDLEEQADKVADEALQVVVKYAQLSEEVSDEQIMEYFEDYNLGERYYYLDDDKSAIYEDTTIKYKTCKK